MYGVVSYAVFFVTLLYTIAFIGNLSLTIGGTLYLPRTIDGSGDAPFTAIALLINLALLSVFALQHSVMARPAFKAVWTKIIPKPIERSTYVLLSSCALILMIAFWQPITNLVWTTDGVVAIVLTVVTYSAWVFVLLSTFMINHFGLLGVKQVWENFIQKAEPSKKSFVVTGFYRICRHPIMLGFIVAFWVAPTMTLGHFLFAFVMSVYIMVAIVLEEKDLLDEFGEKFAQYQKSVGRLFPFRPTAKEETATTAVIELALLENKKETSDV